VPITVADAETITSYEAGIKADLFNRRARASLSVYNYDVKNQQLTVVGGNSNVTKLINAAKTAGRGLEAEIEGFVTPDFKVTPGGSYNFTEIKDPSLYVAKCGTCTVTDPLNAAARGYQRQPAAAGAEVHRERYRALQLAAGSGNLFVLTDWSYRSKINFFLYESKVHRQVDAGRRPARGLQLAGGKYEVAASAATSPTPVASSAASTSTT
jgi:iron complex outermembrane receptor protein